MIRAIALLLSVVAGVLAGTFAGSYIVGVLIIVLSLICYASVLALSKSSYFNFKLITRLQSLWPCLLLCGLASVNAVFALPSPESLPTDVPVVVTAKILDGSSTTKGEQYTLQIFSVKNGTEVYECRNIKALLFASPLIILEPGDIIEYKTVLIECNDVLLGEAKYLTYDVVRLRVDDYVSKGKERYHYLPRELQVIGKEKNLLTIAWELRKSIIIFIENSSLNNSSSRLMKALITGDRSGVMPENMAQLRDGGVAHALAVSGMHVGIFASLLFFITFPLKLTGKRRLRLAIIIIGIWTYALFTGLQYSTIRAALMMSILFLSMLAGRISSTFRSVCISAIIILLLWPSSLWNIGFQLSFICVIALVLFTKPLNPIDLKTHPIIHKTTGIFLVTLIATGATWVVTAYYFGFVSTGFLLSNLIMLPILPLLMWGGILYIFLLSIGFDCGALAYMINTLVDILYDLLHRVHSDPFQLSPPLTAVYLWIAGLLSLAISIYAGHSSSRTLPGAVPIERRSSSPALRKFRISFLSVSIILFISALILSMV